MDQSQENYKAGQGKFNLNNLVKADGNQVDDSARRWFEKLLQRVNLPAELSQAVIDWQDTNDEVTGAMGAEVAIIKDWILHI